MIVMFKMTPEKKERLTKKLDRMEDFLDEIRECLEEGEELEDEEFGEQEYRSNMRKREGTSSDSVSSMRNRYMRRGY